MLPTTKFMKNLKVGTKVRLLIVLSCVAIFIFTVQLAQLLLNANDFVGADGMIIADKANPFMGKIIFMGVIIEGAIVALGVYVAKTIRTNLKSIVAALNTMRDGGVDIELTSDSNDEFGQIITAINEVADTIKNDADIACQIADGDMTLKVSPKTDIDVLGISFKKLLDDNNQVLGNIKEASAQVSTGSEQVASASQAIAQGSAEQASSLEQISASIEDIANRTKVNAEEASNANKLVKEAKAGAVKGNEQMKEMMMAMEEINQSSENISKIIKVIDDIAFQTNILALNAAVEAARAGAQGKGFAVVAEEVRSLAAKSAKAANETAELIESSIDKVNRGSRLAEETRDALEEIVANIDRIVVSISDIAVASSEQATAVTQIDQAIGQVSQVVQSNSATSEECAAASEELSNQALRLKQLIARFKLRNFSDDIK